MRNNQPVNWVHVAMRLTDYINGLGGPQFDGPLQVLDYIDKMQELEFGRCEKTHDLEWWQTYSAGLNAEIVTFKLENMRLRRLNKHKKDMIRRIIKLVNQNGPIEFKDGEDYIRHYTRVHK